MSLHDNHLRYYADWVDADHLKGWADIEHHEDHETTPAKAGQYSWCYECKRVVNKARSDNQPDKRFKDGKRCLINQLVGGYDLPNPAEIINSIPVPEREKSWSFKKATPGSEVHKFGERMTHLLTLSVGLLTVEPHEWNGPQFDEYKARVEEAGFMPLLKPILDNAGSPEAVKRLVVLYAKVSQTMQTLEMEEVQEYIDQMRKMDQHIAQKQRERKRENLRQLREAREAHRAEQQRIREIEEARQEKLRIKNETAWAEQQRLQEEAARKREEERSFWRQEQEKHEALLAANKAKRLEEERARQEKQAEFEAAKAEKLRLQREQRKAEIQAQLERQVAESKVREEQRQQWLDNLSTKLEHLPESESQFTRSVLELFGPYWQGTDLTEEHLSNRRMGPIAVSIPAHIWDWSSEITEIRSDINKILNTYLNNENNNNEQSTK